MRARVAYLLVGLLTVVLTFISARASMARYYELNSAWAWDFAHNNQWMWALTYGDGTHTIRPWATFAVEGPSVWKSNHLDPIRFLIVPFFALNPEPRTLLVAQSVVFWLCVPAAFALVRHESGSTLAAFSAAALVPLTPILWPLALDDFRDIQLGIPFVIVAVDGYRGRVKWLTALGIAWMLACRQEYALVVASLALVPGREAESARRTRRWALTVIATAMGWLLVYFAYLAATAGPSAPWVYLEQFAGPRPSPIQSLWIAIDLLAVGLGSWAPLALLVPRLGVAMAPWIWFLARGLFSLFSLATAAWRKVRYTAPYAGIGLAGGLVGYARLARWAIDRPGSRGRWLLAAAWTASAIGLVLARHEVDNRMANIPRYISPDEAKVAWDWITRVRPDEGVLATYILSAPLSSLQHIYSYIMNLNLPPGYPRLVPTIRWAFLGRGELPPSILTNQGFRLVHEGESLWIFRRNDDVLQPR